jgi:aminoglycoside phosphotransferase
MQSDSSRDVPGHATPDSVVLPDGVRTIANNYRSVVDSALTSEGLSYDYIAVFHVEPRGPSFLVGFRVGLATGDEVFVYVEPDTRAAQQQDTASGVTAEPPLVVWKFPADPKLESLASIVNTEPLGVLFNRLKLGWVPSEVELLSYRPGRRAMVRCGNGRSTAFVKAVRPQTAERVVAATKRARDTGIPSPDVLGWSPAGIAIYDTAEGVELTRAHEIGVSGKLAINAAFEALAMMEKITTDLPTRTPILDNFEWYLAKSRQAHPAEKDALTQLDASIRSTALTPADPEKMITVHGDLHLGQIFVTKDSPHTVSGIIDLGDLGKGIVGDDIASLWSNCVASSLMNTVDGANSFWLECIETLQGLELPPATDRRRLHCSIAVHLVAQTLSTRGLDPAVAHNLILEATAQLNIM